MSKKMTNKSVSKSGFTLLEILLVVGIIAILAGIVILAINPTKQLGDTRDAQRRADVLTILNAVYQYSIDNNGVVPSTIPSTGTCGAASASTTIAVSTATAGAEVNLYSTLVTSSSTYIVSMPTDPLAPVASGTAYGILKSATTGRVTVCAPLAEQGASISVTR